MLSANEMHSLLGHRLHEEIEDFYEYMSPTLAEKRMRTDLVDRITAVVKAKFPGITVGPDPSCCGCWLLRKYFATSVFVGYCCVLGG